MAGLAAFGAIGATLALVGVGVPFAVAGLVAAAAAGLVQLAAQTLGHANGGQQTARAAEEKAGGRLDAYRAHMATLRHDLRGVLSPALMMSDRLLSHPDPSVQRAGTAVVRSIEKATSLLASSRDLMQPGDGPGA